MRKCILRPSSLLGLVALSAVLLVLEYGANVIMANNTDVWGGACTVSGVDDHRYEGVAVRLKCPGLPQSVNPYCNQLSTIAIWANAHVNSFVCVVAKSGNATCEVPKGRKP